MDKCIECTHYQAVDCTNYNQLLVVKKFYRRLCEFGYHDPMTCDHFNRHPAFKRQAVSDDDEMVYTDLASSKQPPPSITSISIL